MDTKVVAVTFFVVLFTNNAVSFPASKDATKTNSEKTLAYDVLHEISALPEHFDIKDDMLHYNIIHESQHQGQHRNDQNVVDKAMKNENARQKQHEDITTSANINKNDAKAQITAQKSAQIKPNVSAKTNKTEDNMDYYAYPRYEFKYDVKDPKTGDSKTHEEQRDGDVVRGQYSYVEPGGSILVVKYTVNKGEGYKADVTRIPAKINATIVTKA